MSIDTCVICFAEDVDIIEYLKISVDNILFLTNQNLKTINIQSEEFSLDILDNILNSKPHINKFIITQNLNCNHEIILSILNKLILYSKNVYNYHPITMIEYETLELLSKNNHSDFYNYSIYSDQSEKHCQITPQYNIPLVIFTHTYGNLSMAIYMSNVIRLFQKKGYKIKHITNSIYHHLLDATQIPDFLYDDNISNILKSAYFKEYINELSFEKIDAIFCSLDFYETPCEHKINKCSRDLVEEIIYLSKPDYLAIGLLDDFCNQVVVNRITSYMKYRCNIECDMFVQTPYIKNPFTENVDYFRLKYGDMSNNRLEKLVSINDSNCFSQLFDSIINKLSDKD